MDRAADLERLLKESVDFFDVIRVCDGGSTDNTKEICDKFKCDFYHREWDDNYHKQDNLLLEQSSTKDWIMIMDDDECPSKPLLLNLRLLIKEARKSMLNMISLPSLLILDDKPECSIEEFTNKALRNIHSVFRKYWLFQYDKSVRSYGTPHRSVESKHGWNVMHQPHPYYHYKTSETFIVNDCIHAWINPYKSHYTRTQAADMYAILPDFSTSRDIVSWLKSDNVSEEATVFFSKHKDSEYPIRNWWNAYQLLQRNI